MKAPRDILFSHLHRKIKEGSDAYVVTADFGCSALDDLKKEFPHRVVNVGIAEQNAILVATGLALEGKRAFCYGIASFITLRCIEMIKVDLNCMDLPVTVVGVGANNEYKELGFTHWCYEDIPFFREFKNMYVYDVKNPKDIPFIVEECLSLPHPKYVRLRRQ